MIRTDDVEHKANETVITRKGDKVGVDKDNMFEVVDDRFAIQKVICDDEKVPGR